jgi:hypothetical protein
MGDILGWRASLRMFILLVAAFGNGFQAKIRVCGWAMFARQDHMPLIPAHAGIQSNGRRSS